MMVRLDLCVVRSFRIEDAPALARHADDHGIWMNLRDMFPHPYREKDAVRFIEDVLGTTPETIFCIEVAKKACGAIGFHMGADVERKNAEVGYWLGREHWKRGIATEALVALTEHAFEVQKMHRLYALPYAHNTASHRVLEKAGYELEGRLKDSSFKDGRFVDQLMYARLSGLDVE